MIELILAIVVIGILAAVAIPRLDRDLRQEAAIHILSMIRYTQHLAQLDNKQMFNDSHWQKRYWNILFHECPDISNAYYFAIGTDDDMSTSNGTFELEEAAIDPYTAKPLYMSNIYQCSNEGGGAVSKAVFISKKFGINAINFSGGCSNAQYIGFDHLGRPHIGFGSSDRPDQSSYMSGTEDCNITFSFVDSDVDPFSIIISKETGYAYIDGQPNS